MLDLMKMDMANFAVSYIRPHLVKQSVEYERSKFQEFLDRHPSEGLLSLILPYFLRYTVTVFCCCEIGDNVKQVTHSGQWNPAPEPPAFLPFYFSFSLYKHIFLLLLLHPCFCLTNVKCIMEANASAGVCCRCPGLH